MYGEVGRGVMVRGMCVNRWGVVGRGCGGQSSCMCVGSVCVCVGGVM